MKITIIILCLLVVGLSGYIVYDKILYQEINKSSDDENNDDISNEDGDNNSQNEEENIGFVKLSEHVELEENIKSNLIEIFNFVYGYYNSQFYGNYCVGGVDDNDIIDPPSGSDSAHKYNIASTEYSSFNEMIDYLKNYMTVNIIYGSRFMDSDNFIEKDGKLYCPFYETGKSGIYEFEESKIKYSKPYEYVIYATMETTLVFGEDNMNELFDVTFSKKDNKWLISSYKLIGNVYD